jgi:hypothetical protein
VSNGIDLRVSRSLELLANLRQTAAKFAQRETQLARDLRQRRHASEKLTEQTVADAEAHHAAQVAGLHEYFQAQQARFQKIYETRLQRVKTYRDTNLRNLPHRTQQVRESWIGKMQMSNSQEQRKMSATLAQTEGAYAGFISSFQTLRALEKRTRQSFRGYWSLLRMLRVRPVAASDAPLGEQLEAFKVHITAAEGYLDHFETFAVPRFFWFAPLPMIFLLLAGIGGALVWFLGPNPRDYVIGGGIPGMIFLAFVIFHALGLGKARQVAAQLAHEIVSAKQIIAASGVTNPAFPAMLEEQRKHLQEEYERGHAMIQQLSGRADEVAAEFERKRRTKLEAQSERLIKKIDRILEYGLQHIEAQRTNHIGNFDREGQAHIAALAQSRDAQNAALAEGEKSHFDEIEADWRREITPIYRAVEEMNAAGEAISTPWTPALVEGWTPPAEFASAARFGRLELDLARQPGILPQNPRLALPGPAKISVPAALSFPSQGSLLFETPDSGDPAVVGTLNNIILRLLSSNPPGKLSFTIIDPVRLGQNFAGLMYLGDYQESIINRRIWTQRDQIEERLAELGEHIEKVIQMYLRNEYATITEYNEQAGSVAEKYHFLVVADFPANFSETAAKRLQSIATSGPRCGIFTLIHWDPRQPSPDGFVPEDLRKNSVCLRRNRNDWALGPAQIDLGATLDFDPPPEAELALQLVHRIGERSIDSNRVQVPFVQIAPKPEELWTGDTTSELKIAIGRTGATKLQYLAIGKGTRQHALFAGKTGSGKSTLFHVIITNLALECSPDQVQFYLIDFKKGVEFKCYATKHLPHAKVVAIESDREFALSVLQRVDDELRRRGDLFRKLGVQDIPGYMKKKSADAEPMPRTLLIIDEFQEFFVEDDSIAQTASLLFDRIVRQGRAFGIHVLLGSQTLGGAYSLARATLGQMVIRVALQCNEADSYLIMDENNSAPRLLSRPGEGIYNDAAGAIEGNSPFQVVWLPDEERDQWLDKIDELKARHPEMHYSSPIVFEGNAPADMRENELLRSALAVVPTTVPVSGRVWLGAPNSIKGPTEAVFQRQSGSHLLIIGQRDEAALTMLGGAILALSAQYPKGSVKFVLFQSAPTGSQEAEFLNHVAAAIPHPIVNVHANGVPAAMNDLAAELQARSAGDEAAHTAPTIFLLIHGLQRFKKLRHEDDFSFSSSGSDEPDAGAQFGKIISDGSSNGIHILATVDTLNNVNHFMNRKALSEFEMRVVFQMGANDSASLIDSPRASTLGLHRAFFYNEHESYLETFRPYAFPDPEWLGEVAGKLSQRS